MDGFTLVDGVVALVVVVSALLAYARGFVRELLAIAGWGIAAVVAFAFAGSVRPLVGQIPYVRDIANSCELSLIVAFAGVFAVVLVLVGIFAPLFASLVQRSAVGPVDQGLGFLFGVVRGLLLVAVAFFFYKTVLDAQDIAMVENSRSAVVFGGLIDGYDPADSEQTVGWIEQQYQRLTGECAP